MLEAAFKKGDVAAEVIKIEEKESGDIQQDRNTTVLGVGISLRSALALDKVDDKTWVLWVIYLQHLAFVPRI